MTADITFAVHSRQPAGSEDDRRLARALAEVGVSVRLAVWSDPEVEWSASPVTLVRSTWDYHLHQARWLSWIDWVAPRTRVANPAGLLRWNSDKHYLQALEGSGVPIVPTRFVDRASPAVWELCAREGWDDVVIKPAVGASAHGARRFRGTTLCDAAQVPRPRTARPVPSSHSLRQP